MSDTSQVLATFQRIWGYSAFRPPQEEIVRTLLNGEDAIIVMPTGGGKSISFQLPALLQTGLTLVISPLVALMENQVQELREKNLPAALLHNEVPKFQRKKTLESIERQNLRLLYLSPETLLSSAVWEKLTLSHVKINGLILDEAHCLTQWGDSFRPTYRRLGTVRPALLQCKPAGTRIAIAAFTATANPTTRETLARVLQLQNPKLFLLDPYRKNLDLNTKICISPRCRRHQLLHSLRGKPRRSGLIYTRSRRESENLATWLESMDYRVRAYHAGLSPTRRREIETRWLSGDLLFVVCTSAFGMGINKADVRWIIHYHAPSLLSEYLQEVGRGGRDGETMEALTLISEPTGWLDNSDRQLRDFFKNQREEQYRQALRISRQIPGEGDINRINEEFPDGAIALALLHGLDRLEWLDPFRYRLISSDSLPKFSINRRDEMVSYLYTRQCRWCFLLNAFGFEERGIDFHCGHCDNCRKWRRD
ncbi:RecQ family ATP-dependent DNA helicase [Pannus brasiliensis CCIBt3594]|uniref:ATP-dependent DNA helicase RecQ n=1 Tax=Pannus brasiliensis CCIBt3594 TaxID=1427578 RepID=A0AAW9QWF6_9CHRO